uniref:PKD domain-containing protein n=1 Tax=Macrostomum lignano TaxID=282301 RepID=A0A1I8J973_9PLAT
LNVKYNWTFSDGGTDFTTVPFSSYAISGLGPASVNVTAYSTLDTRQGYLSFRLISRVNILHLIVDGQHFGNDSAVSISLNSGSDYLCTINASSGETQGPIAALNFRVSAQSSPALYFLTATCYNSLSSSSRTVPLYVEIPVTGFVVETNAAEVGVPFQLEMSIFNGTHPKFQASIAGENKTVVYNSAALRALAEASSLPTAGMFAVVCRTYNNVSDIVIALNVTAQHRISNASFRVQSSAIGVNSYGLFELTMSAGTGVQISVQFGDGNSYNYTTTDLEEWGGRNLSFNHTYTIGGSFTVTATLSNLIGNTTLTLSVSVLAPLGQYALIGPATSNLNNPVQFSFQVLSGSPPSSAKVTFSWGDGSPLETFDMLLTWTYNHTYAALGNYIISFNASNPIPTLAANSTSITIVDLIVNPRATFTPPVLAKGESASVKITIDGGSDVTCTLVPGDGGSPDVSVIPTSGQNTQRILTSTYNTNGTFIMNLTVCNAAMCFVFTHNLKVVNKLQSSTLGLTTNGNQTFGDPIIFTFTYSGTAADAPYGSVIELRDANGTAVSSTELDLPTTQVSVSPAQHGYVSYSFFVYNNGSNFTIQSPVTGNYLVSLFTWNPISNATFSTNITVGGSMINGRVVDVQGVSRPGQTRSLSVVWDVLSEDTCVYVDLGIATELHLYGPAACLAICRPPDNKDYNHSSSLVSNNRIDFSVVYKKRGTYIVKVFTCNQFANDSFTATVAVSPSKCLPPHVTMADEPHMRVENPRKVLRSASVTVECIITELPCEATPQNRREWLIESLDETTRSVTGIVDVSSLPTFGNTILALPPRFLELGLYRVTARVVMNTTVTVEEFANYSSIYLLVGSSPLIVSLTPGGMIEVKRSVGRTICLEPKLNSFDPDVGSIDPNAQGIGSWVYHCWQKGETEPDDSSRSPVQIPRNSSFNAINHTTGCFGSPPGFVQTGGSGGAFCFDGANLWANRTYIFKVQGFKAKRSSRSVLRIITTDLFPAIIDLRCRFPAECHRMSGTDLGYNMVNPTDTVQLTSSCQSSENASVCDSTAWSVEFLDSSNNWVVVDAQTMQAFVQGSSFREVSLSPDLFSNITSRRFRVCLKVGLGTVNEGEACSLLFTNLVPTTGACTCNSTSGVAAVTPFEISCSPFTDSDGIDSYQFI